MNVMWNLLLQICEVAGFHSTKDHRKYLVVALFRKRVLKRSFQFIIEKLDERLSKWKSKTFSFVGRITLAKSVIQAIPTYVMQSILLSMHICDK